MVKTNAEKQGEYWERVKAKQNSDLPKKRQGKNMNKERAFEEIPSTVSRVHMKRMWEKGC